MRPKGKRPIGVFEQHFNGHPRYRNSGGGLHPPPTSLLKLNRDRKQAEIRGGESHSDHSSINSMADDEIWNSGCKPTVCTAPSCSASSSCTTASLDQIAAVPTIVKGFPKVIEERYNNLTYQIHEELYEMRQSITQPFQTESFAKEIMDSVVELFNDRGLDDEASVASVEGDDNRVMDLRQKARMLRNDSSSYTSGSSPIRNFNRNKKKVVRNYASMTINMNPSSFGVVQKLEPNIGGRNHNNIGSTQSAAKRQLNRAIKPTVPETRMTKEPVHVQGVRETLLQPAQDVTTTRVQPVQNTPAPTTTSHHHALATPLTATPNTIATYTTAIPSDISRSTAGPGGPSSVCYETEDSAGNLVKARWIINYQKYKAESQSVASSTTNGSKRLVGKYGEGRSVASSRSRASSKSQKTSPSQKASPPAAPAPPSSAACEGRDDSDSVQQAASSSARSVSAQSHRSHRSSNVKRLEPVAERVE